MIPEETGKMPMYRVIQSCVEFARSRQVAWTGRAGLAVCLAVGFGFATVGAQAEPQLTPPQHASSVAAADTTSEAARRPALWWAALQLDPTASTGWPRDADEVASAAPVNPLWGAAPDNRGPFVLGTVPLRTASRPFRRMSDPVFATANGPNEDLACLTRLRSPDCRHLVPARWKTVLEEADSLDRTARIARVNAEVNARTAYVSDMDNHGILEHWARPSETMASGSGDCEDYAILKFWLLADLGVRPDDMFILIVQSATLSTHHAVLAVKTGGDFVILDNLAKTVQSTRDARHYEPVFSVNAGGLWLHGVPSRRDVASLPGR